ncbi:MAG TPA: DNA repair protein RecO [Spirochaetota bacterium]|nr:DNA repair protein RecO [Spirochaetota bacterium]
MEIQKSTGVVLSSFPGGEADRIARIFTREYGKRTFVFKGIRKSRKRSTLVAEPGTVVDLMYYYHDNREYQVAGEFQVRDHFYSIREDLERIFHLYLILETVEKITGFNDPNRQVFDLLARGLETLSSSHYPVNVTLFFLIHLFRLNGILPDFSSCKICGKQNLAGFTLDYHDCTPVCVNCSGGSRMQGSSLFSSGTGEFLRLAGMRKFKDIDHRVFSGDEPHHVLFSLCMFVEYYFQIMLKSKASLFSDQRDGHHV